MELADFAERARAIEGESADSDIRDHVTALLSARTDEGFETLGNVATGVTDEELAALTELLEPPVRSEYRTDVDIEPAVVFEVGYEEIQPSPTYSSRYTLQFPRFLGVREDRDSGDADSLERVERLAKQQ